VSRTHRQIKCPETKRATLLQHLAEHRADALDLRVERATAARTVGRLCNLSQILPELAPSLHGGYALVESTWRVRGRKVKPPALVLRAGSPAQADWLELIDLAVDLLESNQGVDIAPQLTFPAVDATGTWTVTSDASGIDGVGAYVFCADQPNTVWIIADTWPIEIQAALDEAARTGGARPDHVHGSLSMPAAELFGQIAAAHAVAITRGTQP
jgi:hypothetical protein